MVKTSTELVTIEEFLQRDETKPASEYIDGQIFQKPMPQGEHSAIQTELAAAINAALKSKQMGRAFTELRCTFAGRSIVPDISVFLWSRIPRNAEGRIANTFSIAPDWTIEILSPDQSQSRVIRNILHCLRDTTQTGWLIDPAEQLVFIYWPDHAPAVYDQPDIYLPVPEFARDFQLTVAELFSWLR